MMIPGTITSEMFVARASNAPTSRQIRRIGRPGQGIIDANRKTEICRHWLSGTCPFAGKCAFAHGAHELRTSTDEERERQHDRRGRIMRFMNSATENAPPCCNTRCACQHGCSVHGGDLSWPPRKSRAERKAHAPAIEHDDWMSMLVPMRCAHQASHERCHGDDQSPTRPAFSLWRSPHAALPSTSIDGTDAACPSNTTKGTTRRSAINKATSPNIIEADVDPAPTAPRCSHRAARRKYDTWAMAARGKVADCADGACRQSARCSGLMETGGRSCNGSMLHPKAIARCGSAPEMAPRAEEFSFFHTCRPGLCPATKPPSPGDVAQGFPSNADAGAGRDSAMFDSSRFHEAPGSLGASAVSPPRTITRRSPNLSQDERRYVSAGTTSEAFLPLTDEDLDIEHMRVWSSVPPLLDGEVPRQMKNTDTVDASRLNRYFGDSLHLSSGSEPIAGEHQRDCGGVIALHRLGSDCQPLIKSQRSSARFHEDGQRQVISVDDHMNFAPTKSAGEVHASEKRAVAFARPSVVY